MQEILAGPSFFCCGSGRQGLDTPSPIGPEGLIGSGLRVLALGFREIIRDGWPLGRRESGASSVIVVSVLFDMIVMMKG
ncbi:MAG: hypothetical protein ACU0BZ_11300, partial [Paracoccus sp. (in: a-proteobacteria)]|uniref:hypothetical protein n=1 Tax=Paracoccus sp. TaxID=267 RepID=UPI00405928C2